MRYTYTYRTTARDLWLLSMYYIYDSMAGLCNIIFTVAAFALGFSRWPQAQALMRCLIVLGCCLFTVIQPLAIYAKAKKQAAGITQDTRIAVDDNGLHIKVGNDTSDLPWKSVKRISRKPAMVIIFSDTTHGFLFTNRMLGNEKDEFYRYAASKVADGTVLK
ncbi:MAG: YcxB family protein [Clostridia bacterium]|nr:YcxB family protein [Clostridia bacterium]